MTRLRLIERLSRFCARAFLSGREAQAAASERTSYRRRSAWRSTGCEAGSIDVLVNGIAGAVAWTPRTAAGAQWSSCVWRAISGRCSLSTRRRGSALLSQVQACLREVCAHIAYVPVADTPKTPGNNLLVQPNADIALPEGAVVMKWETFKG